MKKAVYYARVSTSLQEEKRTIESQKNELINQIKNDGNILVKEYIDNGWSGARLDRPALDELRNDLKSDEFDIVYFLDSDRIARDINYQRIIIAELLKHGKEIIIKGQNYIDNPENKLTLTVLGAVNEFEKVKITERMMRGRKEKAKKGAIVDSGCPFGYTHIKKTEKKDGYYKINEQQADIVKYIFSTYSNSDISLNGLCKLLEEKKYLTATRKNYWKSSSVRNILTNSSYYGVHYFNRTYKVEPKNKSNKLKYATTKTSSRLRDESEWIGIKVPSIISKSLFDNVQIKLKRNAKLKRSKENKYIFSSLIKCGDCNHTYTGVKWKNKKYYKCNYRDKRYNHLSDVDLPNCKNKSIKNEDIENIIDNIIKEKILKPSIIKKHIDVLNNKKTTSKKKIQDELKRIDKKILNTENKKKRVLDLYSDNLLNKNNYIEKINEIDLKSKDLENKKIELNNNLSILNQRKNIRSDINYFCSLARRRYKKLNSEKKTIFIQNLIDEIVIFKNSTQNKLIIRGIIPIKKSPNIDLKQLNNDYMSKCYTGNSRSVYNTEVIRFEIVEVLER
jgi:site-specific DNA recombinase